jgi:hypothetical protein
MSKQKIQKLTAFFLYTLAGVSPLLVIKIINDEEFLEEFKILIQKWAKIKRIK